MVLDPARAIEIDRWFRGEIAGELIKQNGGRTVWRIPVGPPGLYAKRFAPTPLRDRAKKEAAMLDALVRAGIRCPRPIATAKDGTGSYLITEEISGARDLYSLIADRAPGVRTMLRALAGVLNRLHDAGFDHQDLHSGNVLVRGDEMFVLDVHRARRRTLSRSARLDGLAFMAMSFSDMLPATEVHRFFRAYGARDRAELHAVWRRLRRLRHEFCLRRIDRCLKEGSGFGVRGRIFYRRGAIVDGLPGTGTKVKKTSGESVERLPDGRFLKRTDSRRARRIWLHAHGLALRGIATPVLDACGPGWVVGEWIDAPNLGDFARERVPAMGRRERDEFLFRLARFVRRLHARGVSHRDLKSSNLLAADRGFLLVDLDRVHFALDIPESDRILNLAQLNASVDGSVTRADRLRFLDFYLRDREHRRRWIAEIMRRTIARRHLWPPR